MKECKDEAMLPCYRDGYGVWHYLDDTHDKVYELNKQMCDIGKTMNDPMKPLSEGAIQEIAKALEITRKPKSIMKERKTKKMTKAEAFEWLKCKKVDTIGLGKEVMKKLSDCGVKWANGKCEYYDFSDYLLIENNGELYHCGNYGDSYWRMHHFEEIYAHDILSMEIIDENKSEEEKALDKISCLGAQIVDILLRMKGHHHVTITETDVILYDEGMSLFHSDPF